MKHSNTFSAKIIKVYLVGAVALLLFYGFAFRTGVMLTENATMERRVAIVAPHHFKQITTSTDGVITIDPLLSLYSHHDLLPSYIRSKIKADWTGSQQLILDSDREFQIFAANISTPTGDRIVYALEESNAVEWDETKFVLTEISLILVGGLLFLITASYLIRRIQRISAPFNQLAEQLEKDQGNNFSHLVTHGEKTHELTKIQDSINEYRSRLSQLLSREKSFTRYVSHELRTPLMVIKGAVSNLNKNSTDKQHKHLQKILKASDQMTGLIQTFLLLARDNAETKDTVTIDHEFLVQIEQDLLPNINANNINYFWQLEDTFELNANEQLVAAIFNNLLINAFASSVDGQVTLLVNKSAIEVVDNGVGLDEKARGYEGFGVGLVLVEDICARYDWSFSLENNEEKGCTANVNFKGA